MIDKPYIIDIVKRAQKNDLLAQRILFDTFSKEMLGVCCKIIGNEDEAKDVFQDSFITALKNIKKLKDRSKVKFWLKKIMINNSLKLLKNRIYFEDIKDVTQYAEDANESDWFEKISLPTIRIEINKLPDGCRQVFVLYVMEGYKHKQIATMLNISESTSKSQYVYALKKLKVQLKKYLDE